MEKEQKCGALQRNFESLSALCLKYENEKSNLEKLKKQLAADAQKQAQDMLDKIQTIKRLEAELEKATQDKKLFDKQRELVASLKEQLADKKDQLDQKEKRLAKLTQETEILKNQLKSMRETI